MSWTSLLRVRRAEGETFLLRRKRVPGIDLSYGDARLAEIRAAAREGVEQWPLIRARLAAATDGEDLTFLLEGVQSVAGVERWIGDVIAAEPDDALPLLVSGARHVAWAWHARTGFAARYVSDEQWELFRTRLTVAEDHLLEAAEREPTWAAPWYFLQITGRGLGVGSDVAERRFAATCRRSPGHVAAHRQHVQQLCPKWGGSWARTHAFARESMLAAPAGSPMGHLVAQAHLEEWLALGGDAESPYLADADVVRAVNEAAARSVYHPDFVRRRDWPLAFNTFAMTFALAGDLRLARPLFQVLGDRATEMPWIYLDGQSPLVPFLAWRARADR
ncbi:hypothetical protein ACIOC1_24630 [Streptomyces sp. NPDC088197]|uniref:hypothetical protein n=1 Tax=Streptomyces sp. NPDC088197 TaxID=3365840 RepID=UPI00380A3A6A